MIDSNERPKAWATVSKSRPGSGDRLCDMARDDFPLFVVIAIWLELGMRAIGLSERSPDFTALVLIQATIAVTFFWIVSVIRSQRGRRND